jgi:glucose/arabinose dehydrogenase
MLIQSPEVQASENFNKLQISLSLKSSGLNQPVHITSANDGSDRLFIVEQSGRIRIIKNGSLLSTPFLDISDRISCCGEQGLLSMAFPPGFIFKDYFYVNYTNISGSTVVARYHVTTNPDIANPNSEEAILLISQPFANHNGGQIAFGPDGYLYIGMGDGGSGGDPLNNAQNPATLLGKMLRIDVESGVSPYSIPGDNPFLQDPGVLNEIWAFGLRNPWRFSFDRLTGDLYIGDVGQNSFEEIDFQSFSSSGGENYGWRIMEGLHCFNPSTGCNQNGLELPVFEYDHSLGCSVSGGEVYRGQESFLMNGIYLFGDFCSGRIWGLQRDGTAWQNRLILNSTLRITSFGEDESRELYVADYLTGDIFKIDCTVSFSDIPSDFWAEEYTERLFCNKITTGCSSEPLNYCPGKAVTRKQMAAFIIRAVEGEPEGECTEPPFSDVLVDNFFCVFIKRMKELGITSGFGDGTFRPNESVSRAQVAAFIVRALEGEPPGDYCVSSSPFLDVSSGHWACRYIKRLLELGITTGCGNGNYCPGSNVTRAEMAAFLARAFLNMQ